MASIQEEQDQSGISTKIDTINDGENKCLVYSPVYESTVPFKCKPARRRACSKVTKEAT